jgi:hypothetical protein
VTLTAYAEATGTNYHDLSPVSSTLNYYSVSAKDAFSPGASLIEAEPSMQASALPLVMPGKPGRFYNMSLNPRRDDFHLTATAFPSAVSGLADIRLNWARALSGSAAIVSYSISRGADLSSLAPVSSVAAAPPPAPPARFEFQDQGLDSSQSHAYAVQAVDSLGNSGEAVQALLPPYTLPGAPAFLTAPGYSGSQASVPLAWGAGSGGSAPLTGYAIFRSQSLSSTGALLLTLPASSLSFTDTSPPAGFHALRYSVFSRNSHGVFSSSAASVSSVASGMVSLTPAAVQKLEAMPLSSTSAAVLLWWNPTPGGEAVAG